MGCEGFIDLEMSGFCFLLKSYKGASSHKDTNIKNIKMSSLTQHVPDLLEEAKVRLLCVATSFQ